ncbi:Uncharacterised protein [uncultured archaeon]|nr:Uncharacterised protein [uncultured archaeon]
MGNYEGEIEKRRIIAAKKEYHFLSETNFFGNRALTWNSIDEIINSGWKGKICICSKKGIERTRTPFALTLEETILKIQEFKNEGIPEETLIFNQSMPDEHLTIQGEMMRSTENYSLVYSTIQAPMNLAFKKETLHATGLKALNLLKGNLCSSSYENMQTIFEMFPDSIIEFSAYDIDVGNILNRNTVIWEVRNY